MLLESFILGAHLVSSHVPAREGQNNLNLGAYVQFENGVTLGGYRNTLHRNSFYIAETVDAGQFSLTLGLISGYEERRTYRYAAPGETCNAAGHTRCWQDEGFAKHKWTLMATPSYRFAPIAGITPRVSIVPRLGKTEGSTAIHLSLERRFAGF